MSLFYLSRHGNSQEAFRNHDILFFFTTLESMNDFEDCRDVEFQRAFEDELYKDNFSLGR